VIPSWPQVHQFYFLSHVVIISLVHFLLGLDKCFHLIVPLSLLWYLISHFTKSSYVNTDPPYYFLIYRLHCNPGFKAKWSTLLIPPRLMLESTISFYQHEAFWFSRFLNFLICSMDSFSIFTHIFKHGCLSLQNLYWNINPLFKKIKKMLFNDGIYMQWLPQLAF